MRKRETEKVRETERVTKIVYVCGSERDREMGRGM